MADVRTEQAIVAHRLVGRTVEIGAGTSPVPGVAVTVDHRANAPGVGCEEGRWAVPDVCADMAALPFRAGAFDTLVAVHLLEHHPDTLAVVAEWARVAGHMVIVCPDQEFCGQNTVALDPTHRAAFTRDQLAAVFGHLGGPWATAAESAIMGWSFLIEAWKGGAMKIETKVTGLSKAKRDKLDGLVAFDPDTELATFEWRADADPPPPHDYATALNRVRDAVADAGGEAGEGRIIG